MTKYPDYEGIMTAINTCANIEDPGVIRTSDPHLYLSETMRAWNRATVEVGVGLNIPNDGKKNIKINQNQVWNPSMELRTKTLSENEVLRRIYGARKRDVTEERIQLHIHDEL
jgi:hypothetical protein